MNRIKVAFFSDVLVRDFDGCLRTVFNIIDRIPEENFEFRFFCGLEPQDDFPYPYHTVPKINVPMNSSYKMALPFLAKRKLEKTLLDFNPDVIHITSPSPLGKFAVNFANNHNIPASTIYHTHFISYVDYYFRTMPALIPLARKAVVSMSKSFYENCQKVFVPTHEMIQDLSKANISSDNMILWPRGIDKNIFTPLRSNKEDLRKLTGNDNANILFASRLVWEKNLKTLIRIYKQIQKENLPYNLLIAGDGVARNELEINMPEAYFLGNLSQVKLAGMYASSDVFVFPSISETYGNVVIEAMASGLPCVIANGGGSRSFIDHGTNGFLCNPNDENDYIRNINKICTNLSIEQRIRLNAFKYVRDLNWESLVSDYFDHLMDMQERNTSSIKAA